nr:hypothetical protein CFP56_41772 [Quercus suber]
MGYKTSIRLIIISMLFFLCLSSTIVIADPSNLVPPAKKKSSLPRAVVAQRKLYKKPPTEFSKRDPSVNVIGIAGIKGANRIDLLDLETYDLTIQVALGEMQMTTLIRRPLQDAVLVYCF